MVKLIEEIKNSNNIKELILLYALSWLAVRQWTDTDPVAVASKLSSTPPLYLTVAPRISTTVKAKTHPKKRLVLIN